MLPLGLSTVVIAIWLRTSSSDSPLATSLAGSIWMRIGRLLLAADEDLGDAGNLADLLGELGVGVVATSVSGSVSEVADNNRIGESAGLTLR